MSAILVVGAGAIGGITAARLAEQGVDVTVLDADAAHVARLRERGVRLHEADGHRDVRVRASGHPDELASDHDAALLTVKAPALAQVVPALVRTGRIGALVSLGNGLVHDHIDRMRGDVPLVVGVVEWGATNHGPAGLEQTTSGRFVLGAPGLSTTAASAVAAMLGRAWPVTVADDVLAHVWSKLLLNSTLSGLGTVLGATYAEVLEDPIGRRTAVATWREGARVARALGLVPPPVAGVAPDDLDDDATTDRALEHLASRLGPTRASMLQDLERGATTEVAWINGGVRERGEACGVPTPCNTAIETTIRRFERGEGRPGLVALRQLDRHLRSPDHHPHPHDTDHDPEGTR